MRSEYNLLVRSNIESYINDYCIVNPTFIASNTRKRCFFCSVVICIDMTYYCEPTYNIYRHDLFWSYIMPIHFFMTIRQFLTACKSFCKFGSLFLWHN